MIRFHDSFFCRTAACLVAILLVFQGEFMLAQGNDVLADQFGAARSAYLAGDYATARSTLAAMLPELEKVPERETLKGETCLLLGAALEKLGEKEAAVRHYCLAREMLGAGQSLEGLDLNTLQFYAEPCPDARQAQTVQAVLEEDIYETQFTAARTVFFAENYQEAKNILEKLFSAITDLEGRDTFRGEIYLLGGAVYEKLKYKELAVKYFCLAKEILGKGKTFSGLVLKDYKYYKNECAPAEVTARAAVKKGGFGRFFGALLGLAVLVVGGYFLYTKVIKKKDDNGDNVPIYYETEYQAWNCWHASASSSSSTLPTIAPANSWAPQPSFSNSYDAESNLSITGPEIYHWEIKLAITACQGLTRRDIVYVNDVQVIDVTNQFNRACAGNINDFCANPAADGKEYAIASGSGEATLKLRHKIVFTAPANTPVRVLSDARFQIK